MTDLRDAFVDKQMKRLEDRSFGFLRKNGLFEMGKEQFARMDLPESRIVRNAFLLNFESKLRKLSEINADIIMHCEAVASSCANGAKTLQSYATANENNQIMIDGEVSNDMLAAALCATISNDEYDQKDVIGLIGAEAYRMLGITDQIRKNPHYFSQNSISPEERSLHLSRITQELNLLLKASDNEIDRTSTIRQSTYNHAQMLIEHIDDLGLKPAHSTFEEYVLNKRNALEEDIHAAPISAPGKVVNIFSHS